MAGDSGLTQLIWGVNLGALWWLFFVWVQSYWIDHGRLPRGLGWVGRTFDAIRDGLWGAGMRCARAVLSVRYTPRHAPAQVLVVRGGAGSAWLDSAPRSGRARVRGGTRLGKD